MTPSSQTQSLCPAPKGAGLNGPAPVPAILLTNLIKPVKRPRVCDLNRPPQGPSENIDASPTHIARMLRTVFANEAAIKPWENRDGLAPEFRELMTLKLKAAVSKRDEHLDELRHLIDYALTTAAYDDVPCPGCRLPADALLFIRALPGFEPPAMQCKTCKSLGTIRQKKTGEEAKAAFKQISHFKRVMKDTVLVAKIRARTDESSDAYLELEARHQKLLKKFGNEKGSPLEGDDAAQSVRQGILDACRLYDPTDSRMAAFGTVAYWWCMRNSRARQAGQKRAGLYAPSVDGMFIGDSSPVTPMITSFDGALGKLGKQGPRRATWDRCRLCGDISAIDAETWLPTGLCKVHVGTKENSKIKLPGADYVPRGSIKPCSEELRIDLHTKLSGLDEDERAVMAGELQGLTTSQIAARYGFSNMKVRGLRARAFAALRVSMVGYAEALHD